MRRSVAKLFAAYVPQGWSTVPCADNASVTQNHRLLEVAAQRADEAKENKGFFFLPRIDYDVSEGVPPLLSKRAFDIQYRLFHKEAVNTLNKHTLGTELEGHNLSAVIRATAFDASRAVVHTAAAEHFNYCFWYRSLRPWGTAVPARLKEEIQLQYSNNGTLDALAELRTAMTNTALSHQERCGWVYLVWTGKGFDVVTFPSGTCPIGTDLTPLVAINMHASAIAVDYKLDLSGEEGVLPYINNFFKCCNWRIAEEYYLKATEKN